MFKYLQLVHTLSALSWVQGEAMWDPSFFQSMIGDAGSGNAARDNKTIARVGINSHMDDCCPVFNKRSLM